MDLTTAYGAPISSPRQSAALLRALAARAGLELAASDDCDLTAAVIAADTWCRVTHLTDLGRARYGGHGASEAAGAILARAAGYGDAGAAECHRPDPAADIVLAHLSDYLEWATGVLGPELAKVSLWRAGSDLACTDRRLEGAGFILQAAASAD